MKGKEVYMYALGALVVIGFFVLVILVFIFEIPSLNREIGLMTIGALIGNFNSIIAYFFGSSKGSSDKTELLTKKE